METGIDTTADETAAIKMRSLIERTLAGARVPRETRERLSPALEGAMRENLGLVRQYVRTISYDGRAAQMMRLYVEGKTLHEIGDEYGITRERVRQILTSTFGDYRSAVPEEIAHERSLRRQAEMIAKWDAEHGEAITSLFNEGQSDPEIAKVLDIPYTRVTEYRSRHHLRHVRTPDWTPEALTKILRRCYGDVGQGLTIARYNEWRERVGVDKVPSYLTILIRFDAFEKACEAAGVPYVGRSNSMRRSDFITPEMAHEFLVAFLDWTEANGMRATSGTYAEYRKVNAGAPSMAVMSRRLGGFRERLDELIAERSE